MAAAVPDDVSVPSAEWARRYPPVLTALAALALAVFVLPSSLNVPQTPPSQTLEIAPVPPSDEDPPAPPSGNFSQLGLGGSSTLANDPADDGVGGDLGVPPPPPPPGELPVEARTPQTKECVKNEKGELRQTADPLAPPCVGNFSGDNFGATYQGVTAKEVRIVSYHQGNTNYLGSSGGSEVTPDGRCFDLAEPARDDDHVVVRTMRVWQQYFNERYQTYDRFVHFYTCFGRADESPEARLSDAVEHFNRYKPFAVLTFADANADSYLEAMAKRKVLNFGSFVGRDAAFFQRYPKLIWGFFPSLEQQAGIFVSQLCTQVKPFNTSFSANAGENGKPRKYALWSTRDAAFPGLQLYAKLVKEGVAKCGITFDAEHTFPGVGFTHDARYVPTYASTAVADMKQKGITTIIWPGGLETNLSKAGAAASYYPEVIVSGDRVIESEGFDDDQQQAFWDQVAVVANVTAEGAVEDSPCYQAYRETDPSAPRVDITFIACRYYQDIRQLFIGIQVAGPRLGPTSVDKGLHAIPAVRSDDPRVPACFYNPGDYTCVKDALLEHYDAADGCYKMSESGARYIAGSWPERDIAALFSDDDPCNSYTTGSGTYINPEEPNPEDPEGRNQ